MEATIRIAQKVLNGSTPILHIAGLRDQYWKRYTANRALGNAQPPVLLLSRGQRL